MDDLTEIFVTEANNSFLYASNFVILDFFYRHTQGHGKTIIAFISQKTQGQTLGIYY